MFYAQAMTAIGLSSKVPADRRRVGRYLDAISESTWSEHGFVLSAMVHLKGAGRTRPTEITCSSKLIAQLDTTISVVNNYFVSK